MDDFLSHQIVEPQSKVSSLDPRWLDRFYFSIFGDPSLPVIETGMGAYMNRNSMDAFCLVRDTGVLQHSWRGTRRLDGDAWHLQVGPARFRVVEPLSSWEFFFEDDNSPVQFALTYSAVNRVYEAVPLTIMVRDELASDHRHYIQFGIVNGEINYQDESFIVEDVVAIRDRSWGIRNPQGAPRRGLVLWCPAEFDHARVWFWQLEYEDGRRHSFDGFVEYKGGTRVGISGIAHDIEFADGAVAHATVEILTVEGSSHEMTVRPRRSLFLHTAGYSADGHGSTASGGSRGTWRADRVDGEGFVRSGLIDNICDVEMDGFTGVAIFETGLGRHYRYPTGGLDG